MLLYRDVTIQNLADYEKILTDAGYLFTTELNGQRSFENDMYFATLAPNEETGELALTIGNFKVFYAPFPPWPDPLPEQLKRILPRISAKCTTAAIFGGYEATAESIDLEQIFHFFTALTENYGWSTLSEFNEMTNTTKGVNLKVVSCNTDQKILTIHITYPGATEHSSTP